MTAKPYSPATLATSRRRKISSSRASRTSTWTLLATSSWDCSISRIACPPVAQFAASNSSFGVSIAAFSVRRSARKYSSSMPKEYSLPSSRPVAERITRCCLSSLRPSRSFFNRSKSNAMLYSLFIPFYIFLYPLGLQPSFQQRRLPEPRMALGAHLGFRMVEHVLDEILLIEPARPRLAGREQIAHVIEERPAQITQRRHREIA